MHEKVIWRLFTQVKQEVGHVSIVINNAGIMPCDSFLNHSPTTLEKLFKVNVFAHFWILREFLPDMISRGTGHIVTTISVAGIFGVRNIGPYCASKHAVHGYIEGLRDELAHLPNGKKADIKFTSVYPYCVNTGLLNNVAKCNPRYVILCIMFV